MEKARALFDRDRFAAHNGIELTEVGLGFARARMPIDERHLNGFGSVHGGAVYTLADFAFGAASNSHGPLAVSVDCQIAYFKGVTVGAVLTADASENSLRRRLASYTVRITDEHNTLVALFHGTAYRKDQDVG